MPSWLNAIKWLKVEKWRGLTIFLVVDNVQLALVGAAQGPVELGDAVRCGQFAVQERGVNVLLHNLSFAEPEQLAEFVIAEDDGPLGLRIGHHETPIWNCYYQFSLKLSIT